MTYNIIHTIILNYQINKSLTAYQDSALIHSSARLLVQLLMSMLILQPQALHTVLTTRLQS